MSLPVTSSSRRDLVERIDAILTPVLPHEPYLA